MFFLKGDATESLRSLHDVLDYCKSEDDSLHYISLRVRAMILMSQVQHTFSSIQSTNIMILNEALSLAKKYHLHYLAATVEMHIANVQLHTGCSKNALVLVRKVLPTIMAHGSTYDMARGKYRLHITTNTVRSDSYGNFSPKLKTNKSRAHSCPRQLSSS